ncbi:hypothetical protein BASA61_008418 [Batrachochytrium salamandrivorans]|nr:hypothetical protein BASA61_008418 [Batrachochytrium salamandrivorans]
MASSYDIPLPFGDFDPTSPIVRIWTFVVYTLLVVMVTLFFLFYLGRTITKPVAWLIGLFTWRRFSFWFDLGSVSFAPLRGRIHFRDLRIYTKDASVMILQGRITFRYWKLYTPSTQTSEESSGDDSMAASTHIKLQFDGLECFVYNRSSAYDMVENLLLGKIKDTVSSHPTDAQTQVKVLSQNKNMSMFRWPFEVSGTTGSVIIGNPDLPNILTIAYKKISGIYTSSETTMGVLQDNVRVQLKSFKVTIRPNVDFKEPKLNYASRLRIITDPIHWSNRLQSFLFPKPATDTDIPLSRPYQWEGLQRFMETADAKTAPNLEYAQASQVIDSKLATVKYFSHCIEGITESCGCDIELTDSKIVYGPWAQRQRNIIQSFFSPLSYRDSPTRTPRALFECNSFPVTVTFLGESTIKIPTRESSRDAMHSRAEGSDTVFPGSTGSPIRKPYGWIIAEFKPSSMISLTIPLFSDKNGSVTSFNISLCNVVLKTSVNFQPFIIGRQILIEMSIFSPLKWNAQRDWQISCTLLDCDVYLLRQHITLVVDIMNDLNSHPPPTIEYFVPSVYKILVDFQNLKLLFNINPMNVTQSHNDKGSNDYLILATKKGALTISVSFKGFEPDFREIVISGELGDVALTSSFHDMHKLKLFLKSPFNNLLVSPRIAITASYIYRKIVPGACDRLNLMFELDDCNINAHGHILSTTMSFLRNFLGDATQIATPDTYSLDKLIQPLAVKDRNAFELHLQWRMCGISFLLPCSMYGASDSMLAKGNTIHVDLHSKVDGQDIHISFSPITLTWDKSSIIIRDLQLHIQRFSSGRPKFDLLLSSWNIHIGDLLGDLQPKFVGKLNDVIQSFLFNMQDVHPLVKEYTDARTDSRSVSVMEIMVKNVELCLRLDKVLARLLLPQGLFGHTNSCLFMQNDISRFLHIPLLVVSSLQLPENARQGRTRNDYAPEVFRLETSVILDNRYAFEDADTASEQQYRFLVEGDAATGGRLWAFLNRTKKDLFGPPTKPPTFYLRMPFFFQKVFAEYIQRSPTTQTTQSNDLLNRVPSSMSGIYYASHLSIYDIESVTTSMLYPNIGRSSQGRVVLVKHSNTPPLDLPIHDVAYLFERTEHALPGENRVSIRFKHNSSLVLTPLSLQAVLQAVHSLTSDHSSESAGDFVHILDAFQRRHAKFQKPSRKFSFLNIYSVFFSTINVRLVSSLTNDRRTVCIADLVVQSFSGFAKMKEWEFVPGQVELRLGNVDCSLRIKENQQFQNYQIPGVPKSVWEESEICPRNIMTVSRFEIEAVDAIVDVLIMQIRLWRGFVMQLYTDLKELMRMPTNLMQHSMSMVSIFQETSELSSLSGPSYIKNAGLVDADDDVGLLLIYLRLVWDIIKSSKQYELVRIKAPELLAVSEGNLDTLCSNILRRWGHIPTDNYPSWFLRMLDPAYEVAFSTSQPSLPFGESCLVVTIGSVELSVYDESGESNSIKLINIGLQPRVSHVFLPPSHAAHSSQVVVELMVVASLDSLEMCIYPKFITFVLGSLKDWRRQFRSSTELLPAASTVFHSSVFTLDRSTLSSSEQHRTLSLSGILHINSIIATIQERNVEARLQLAEVVMSLQSGYTSHELTLSIPHSLEYSFNASVRSTLLELSERVLVFDIIKPDTILTFEILGVQTNVARTRIPTDDTVMVVKIEKANIRLPRSLIKIQMFFEKLRAEDIPRYSNAFRDATTLPLSPIPLPEPLRSVAKKRMLDFSLSRLSVESELLTNFRFSYDLFDTTVSVLHQGMSNLTSKITYLYRFSKQYLRFISPEGVDMETHPLAGVLPLPTSFSIGSVVYSRGDFSAPWNSFFSGNVVLENIDAGLDIDIVDQLLTTYSVLASELGEVVRMVAFYTGQRSRLGSAAHVSRSLFPEQPKGVFKYAIKVTVKDISLSINNPLSSVMIASSLFDGYLTNNTPDSSASRLIWSIAADGLSISLHQRTPNGFQQTLASVTIDLTVRNWRDVANELGLYTVEDVYDVDLSKVHALMQPIAVDRIVDVITFWQNALRQRNSARKESLSEVRLNTKSVLESFKVKFPGNIDQPTASVILARPIRIRSNNLSVLVPIVDGFDLQNDWKNFQPTAQAEAVLLYLDSAVITRDGSVSQAQLSKLSVMFISSFNPSNEHDFDPASHFSQNKAVLPLIRVTTTQETTPDVRRVKMNCNIDGFSVELDSSISKKISTLGRIYERGKQAIHASFPLSSYGDAKRLQMLGKTVGRLESALINSSTAPHGNGAANSNSGIRANIPDLGGPASIMQVDGVFEFASGSIIVRNIPQASRSIHSPLPPMSSGGHINQDTFLIPGLTLIVCGATTTVGELKSENLHAPRGLHMELTIHPSDNVLNPSIIEFFEELALNFQTSAQARETSAPSTDADPNLLNTGGSVKSLTTSASGTKLFIPFIHSCADEELETAAQGQWKAGYTGSANYASLGITLLLRLSKTRIGLSCQPYAKVECALQIEKADFLFSFTPKNDAVAGRRFLSCSANISKVRGYLRHVFASEDCIRSEIPAITFSVTVDQTIGHGLALLSTFSISQLTANVNMRQLQDLFLFVHLWKRGSRGSSSTLSLHGQKAARGTNPDLPSLQKSRSTSHDSISVAMIIENVNVIFEMGTSIGRASFSLKTLNLGLDQAWHGGVPVSRVAHTSVASMVLSIEGRLVGSISLTSVKGFAQAIDPQDSSSGVQGTTVSLSTDCILVDLQYQNERILFSEILSLAIVLNDHWYDSQLGLNVDVLVKNIKFIVSKHAAPRCMQLFRRITTSIKEKDVLAKTQLANANAQYGDMQTPSMPALHVPPRYIFALPDLQRAVECKVKILCENCVGTASRNNFRDPDCAQINLVKLEMSLFEIPLMLDKLAETTIIKFDKLTIKKLSIKPVSQAEERMWDMTQWFTFLSSSGGSDVLQFPALSMHLKSESDLAKNRVEYSFRTDFKGRVYVTLNIGLYKYLLDLVKTYNKAVLVLETDDKVMQNQQRQDMALQSTSPTLSRASSSQDDPLYFSSVVPSFTAGARFTAGVKLQHPRAKPVLVRTGELVFEPQLQVTGDATPTELVEKLGVKKEDIPRMIYTNLTVMLSDFTHTLGTAYKSIVIYADEDGFLSTQESLQFATSDTESIYM